MKIMKTIGKVLSHMTAISAIAIINGVATLPLAHGAEWINYANAILIATYSLLPLAHTYGALRDGFIKRKSLKEFYNSSDYTHVVSKETREKIDKMILKDHKKTTKNKETGE